ncbi:hypothetical protein [Microbulbifer sp. JTAC008]|uniref:hypothetical protein n=1 Tax=unclassified Microbulbifer TaxID=2619833 RepID=UPI004039B571
MKKVLSCLLMLGISSTAQSFTECTFTPEHVWLGLDGENVWIKFTQGNAVFKTTDTASERQLNSILSMSMAAISADRNIVVRYNDDDVICSALTNGDQTNNILGIKFK